MAISATEMAPDLIWAPYFFWPQEIWASKKLVPDKYGLQEILTPRNLFPKFLGDQNKGPNEIGDHLSTNNS